MSGNGRDSSPHNTLGPLQRELLEAFGRRENRFFLTGGAALAGFHLGHRQTEDLDLFSVEDALESGVEALGNAASELGASLEPLRTSPSHLRFLARRGAESVVVDLVRDRSPQLVPVKPLHGSIRVDPPEEIFANKLCTLLSRAELRDLVDVRALERSGLSLEDALRGAQRKDLGLTPGQLAWVLSEIEIGPDAEPPGGVSAQDLRSYAEDLVSRLARLSMP